QDVFLPSLDRVDRSIRPATRTRLAVQLYDVADLVSDERLRESLEHGEQQPRAGHTLRHSRAAIIDDFDYRAVFEQMLASVQAFTRDRRVLRRAVGVLHRDVPRALH